MVIFQLPSESTISEVSLEFSWGRAFYFNKTADGWLVMKAEKSYAGALMLSFNVAIASFRVDPSPKPRIPALENRRPFHRRGDAKTADWIRGELQPAASPAWASFPEKELSIAPSTASECVTRGRKIVE